MQILSDYRTDTNLILAPDFDDLPADFPPGNLLLSVRAHGAFYVQRITPTDKPFLIWCRTVRPNTTYPWSRIIAKSDELASANIVCLGDSLTELSDWPARVADMTGATVTSGGMGGTRLTESVGTLFGMAGVDVADAILSGDWTGLQEAAQFRFDATGDDNRPIVARLAATNWASVTHFVCFWGTNDWTGLVPLGDDTAPRWSDRLEDRVTIRGGVNYVTRRLLQACPMAKVVWVTPPFRARQKVGDAKSSDDFANDIGVWLHEVGDAIRETAARRWHVPALDLYRTSGVGQINYVPFLRDQTIDGNHWKIGDGTQRVAEKIAGFLRSA